MKKRLLLSLMAMCMGVSSFALSLNEYVYTPQGRFQISGETVVKHDFTNLDGWNVVSATEGQTIDGVYAVAEDTEAGFWYAQSLVATAGEGIYLQLNLSNDHTYVVSFKMKGAFAETTRIKTDALSTDLVLVQGNTDGVYGGTTDVLTANTAEELSEGWQTFTYAIVPDGISRTWFISLTGMATTAQIADLQIAPAYQVADLRQRDAMVEKMEAYKNVYGWDQAVLDDFGYDENLNNLKAIGDESTQDDLDEQLKTCADVLADFLKENMDDYLAGDSKNYLGLAGSKTSGLSTYGIWTLYPGGRGYTVAGDPLELGHYQAASTWNYNQPTGYMGVSTKKELSAGSYVFAIEGKAFLRENVKNSWTSDDGLKPAYGVAYIVKVPAEGVEATAADTILTIVKDLDPVDFTSFILPAKIEADGNYEFGLKVYCKEAYQTLKRGSVVYVKDASFWGKNDNAYNVAQLAYEADVREQITTGRNALTTAAEYLANAEKYWGKAELQACVDTIETKIAAYELMSQDKIIATYDKDLYNHDNRVKNADEGLLVFEVYDTATKYIIAANRTFVAVNDTLESLQKTIDLAEATLKERIYDAAKGKADLQAAIVVAKGVQTTMKAGQYSEENAADIVAANKTLNEAIATFKTTIPTSAITEIVSLDFEGGAAQNAESQLYESAGTNTTMTYSYFATETPATATDLPFELGIDVNGEKLLPGVLRVGNGEATATIPANDYGTNILKVSMDWWFVRLQNRYTGFDLIGVQKDEEAGTETETRAAGLYFSPYDGTFGSGYDDFSLDQCDTDGANNSIKGFFVGNTTGDAGSCADDNKTHMEVILDFGEKSMYLVSTTPSGILTSNKVAFNGLAPVKFVVKSNYQNYNGRRSWFDNLKIEQIQAGETEQFQGIKEINTNETKVAAPTKVFKNGRIIINGKYGINGMLIK